MGKVRKGEKQKIDMTDPESKTSERYWIWGPLVAASMLMLLVYLTHSNQRVFFWLNDLSRYTGDALWADLTIWGDGLVVFVLLLPWIRKRPDVVWTAILALMVSTLAVQGLKSLFAAPRPAAVLDPQMFHIIGKKLAWRSFPSGHTADIFTIAGVWSFAVSQIWLRLGLLAFAILVGVSRVVVGAHWPLDIPGGLFVGWVAARIGLVLAKQWPWGTQPAGRRFLGILLLAAAIWLLLLHNTGYPQSVWLQWSIAVICLFWGGHEVVHLLQEPSHSTHTT